MKENIISSGGALLAAAVLGFGACAVFAQAPAAPQKGWETTAAAGLTLTRGNSSTVLGTLSLDTRRKWEHDEARFGIGGAYGEANGTKNQQAVVGFAQYNHLFTERLYGGLRLDGLYDGIANLDYRLKVSPILGYYLVKNARTSLALEAGPSVVFEKFRGQKADTFIGARVGERFEHKLTDTTKIWQSLEFIARVDRWDQKYLLVGEVGIDTAITKQLSLRAVLQDTYDNEPAAGRKKNDLRLITGVAYKF